MFKRFGALWRALALASAAVMLAACADDGGGDDPFAGLEDDRKPDAPADTTTLAGIHERLFAVRCANPTCHDGSFEPDFRTVYSTYNTLVWQPTVKPDPDTVRDIDLRVVPFEPDSSWLMERLVTDDTVNLGRMPSNGWRLPANEIAWVRDWIARGAPAPDGSLQPRPNYEPEVLWYAIYDQQEERIEAREDGWSSAARLPRNQTVEIRFRIEDDSTEVQDLRGSHIRWSYNRDDFSDAGRIDAEYFENWAGWQRVFVKTGQFRRGEVVWFRFYTRDPAHESRTEYPLDEDASWLKRHYSFIVQ